MTHQSITSLNFNHGNTPMTDWPINDKKWVQNLKEEWLVNRNM